MRDWIAKSVHKKEEEVSKPWTAGPPDEDDKISAENEYYQRYVLPKAIRTRDVC